MTTDRETIEVQSISKKYVATIETKTGWFKYRTSYCFYERYDNGRYSTCGNGLGRSQSRTASAAVKKAYRRINRWKRKEIAQTDAMKALRSAMKDNL